MIEMLDFCPNLVPEQAIHLLQVVLLPFSLDAGHQASLVLSTILIVSSIFSTFWTKNALYPIVADNVTSTGVSQEAIQYLAYSLEQVRH